MSEKESFNAIIERTQDKFISIANDLPVSHRLSFEAEARFAIQHLQNNDYLYSVAKQNPRSLQSALCNLAGVGLSLNPAEKFCYLIPRNVKIGRGQYESRVYAEPSYMGLCRLATDTGSIKWVQARVVRTNDTTFVDNGPGEKPTHTYDARLTAEQRGAVQAVYCVAKTADGDYLTTIMDVDKINDIRDRTEIFKKAAKDGKPPYGPWVTDWEEQAKKTVIRNAFKTWPRSAQSEYLAQAIHLSNENMGFDPIVSQPPVKDYTAQQKEYFDQLIERDDCLEMYVLSQTTPSAVFSSLYNSWESGSVTKGKRIVDEMMGKGKTLFQRYVDAYNPEDEIGIDQLRSEVTDDCWNLITERAA